MSNIIRDSSDVYLGMSLVQNGTITVRSPKSPRMHQEALCKGFRTSDPQRTMMGKITELSPLASMLFLTFKIP